MLIISRKQVCLLNKQLDPLSTPVNQTNILDSKIKARTELECKMYMNKKKALLKIKKLKLKAIKEKPIHKVI